MGIVLIKSTMPHHKARAATTRPTTPPERVSISLFKLSAVAAPVASAAALPEADEAADAKICVSMKLSLVSRGNRHTSSLGRR